jgi:hypothetical protein
MMLEISAITARRYVMGRQGLWPGRRWQGLEGAATAMRTMEHLQLDPLMVVARAHDLMLASRVVDYAIDDWARLTYEQRRFFEWGGWLAVRPMDELPLWRVLMRREARQGMMARIAHEHPDAVDEMRTILQSGREVSNREFEMRDRTRVESYRGRKDSALALHYLWRTGEAMVSRRDRFERVYAATEAVAPPEALREVREEEADDLLLRKEVAAGGLTRLTGVNWFLRRDVPKDEVAARQARWIASNAVIEVKVEGWRATQLAVASDVPLLAELESGRVPGAWKPIDSTTDEEAVFLSPLDPVSARGRAKPLFGFEYSWEVYTPAAKRRFGYYVLPILWGDRLVGRFDAKLDRATRTLRIPGLWLEDPAVASDAAFTEALGRGMQRFIRLLDAQRIDVSAVPQVTLRKRLRGLGRPGAGAPVQTWITARPGSST